MKWLILSLLGLITCSSVSLYRLQHRSLLKNEKHNPKALNILNFQRDSVESLPQELEINEKVKYSDFGSKALPLRDAVEARPNLFHLQGSRWNSLNFSRQKDERIPLRDAVEHRAEPYFDNTLDHESIWLEQLSPPAVRKVEKEFKVVCHLEAGAVYRMEPFSLLPQAIPTRKCTHLVYNSATIDVTPDLDDAVEIVAASKPSTTTTLPLEDCNGRLFIAHEKDCSKYLLCNFGQLSEQSCPNGLLWNEDRCDWPYLY